MIGPIVKIVALSAILYSTFISPPALTHGMNGFITQVVNMPGLAQKWNQHDLSSASYTYAVSEKSNGVNSLTLNYPLLNQYIANYTTIAHCGSVNNMIRRHFAPPEIYKGALDGIQAIVAMQNVHLAKGITNQAGAAIHAVNRYTGNVANVVSEYAAAIATHGTLKRSRTMDTPCFTECREMTDGEYTYQTCVYVYTNSGQECKFSGASHDHVYGAILEGIELNANASITGKCISLNNNGETVAYFKYVRSNGEVTVDDVKCFNIANFVAPYPAISRDP